MPKCQNVVEIKGYGPSGPGQIFFWQHLNDEVFKECPLFTVDTMKKVESVSRRYVNTVQDSRSYGDSLSLEEQQFYGCSFNIHATLRTSLPFPFDPFYF